MSTSQWNLLLLVLAVLTVGFVWLMKRSGRVERPVLIGELDLDWRLTNWYRDLREHSPLMFTELRNCTHFWVRHGWTETGYGAAVTGCVIDYGRRSPHGPSANDTDDTVSTATVAFVPNPFSTSQVTNALTAQNEEWFTKAREGDQSVLTAEQWNRVAQFALAQNAPMPMISAQWFALKAITGAPKSVALAIAYLHDAACVARGSATSRLDYAKIVGGHWEQRAQR